MNTHLLRLAKSIAVIPFAVAVILTAISVMSIGLWLCDKAEKKH